MNRRNFFKFLAKGATIVGAAGVLGLPGVEAKEWKFNVPKYDKNAVFNGSFSGWCITGETVDGATIKEMYEKAKSLFLPDFTTEQRKQFAREVIKAEKQLPGLMPMWKDGHLFDALNYAAQGLENLEISAHKASKAMQKFNSTIEENELDELLSNS